MSKHVTTLVVGSFADQHGAEAALKQFKQMETLKIYDAALVEKSADNRLKVKDTKDWGWGKGAIAGGIAGLVVGLLIPPAGVAIATLTGAGAGAIGAGLHDVGISSDALNALGATLAAGGSAVVLAVDPAQEQAAEDALKAAGAATVRQGLGEDVVAALRKQEVAESESEAILNAAQNEARMQ
ncbi:MAG: DUF1269 domain-containing protein [Anaerolineales bacterium]|nr:DUF1269 domain-containing protein [Anaerolineales bacterium]